MSKDIEQKNDYLYYTKEVNLLANVGLSKKITLSAKGLYFFLVAKKDLTGITLKSLSSDLNTGVHAIKSAMDQLKDHGLVSFEKNKDGTTTYKTHYAAV